MDGVVERDSFLSRNEDEQDRGISPSYLANSTACYLLKERNYDCVTMLCLIDTYWFKGACYRQTTFTFLHRLLSTSDLLYVYTTTSQGFTYTILDTTRLSQYSN
jgi:hypothetical protein